MPSGASAILPSHAINKRPDWVGPAGISICFAVVPRISVTLNQNKDSRKILGRPQNINYTIVENYENKTVTYIVSLFTSNKYY
jgi:hypothetical protein